MAQESVAVGRRKSSIAWVRVRKGKGNIIVNGKRYNEYFSVDVHQMMVVQPLQVVDALGNVDIRVRASGGGVTGQAGAVRLGIARALVEIDPGNRDILKKNGFLTRDQRRVERKKYGRKKARRSFQFSKR